MYYMSHTGDEYNKGGNELLMKTGCEERTLMTLIAEKSDKALSRERKEKQNKPLVAANEAPHQEKESIFPKNQLQKTQDSFELKIESQSSEPVKPLPASEEPSHYSEFATKLGYLMEKVTELAKGSGSVSVKNSEGKKCHNVLQIKSSNTIKSKIPQYRKDYPDSDNIKTDKVADTLDGNRRFGDSSAHKDVGQNYACKLVDSNSNYHNRDKIQNMDPQYLTYRMANKYDTLAEQTVPPILNNNIKYIRVSSQDFNKWEHKIEPLKKELEPILSDKETVMNGSIRHLEKDTCQFGEYLSCGTVRASLKLSSYMKDINAMTGTDQELFRILISGHLTTRETPIFIIHKNYAGSSALIKDSLDFKARKKEGNVDILLTGKFCHDNILIENDKGYPFALDLKSHKLLIDSKNIVTKEKFRHIFHLGLFDAVLEGEFVENRDTLQYIPIFSLEVVKHKQKVEINFDEPTTLIKTHENILTNNLRDETKECKTDKKENTRIFYGSQDDKHVHYLVGTQDNKTFDASMSMKPKKLNKKPKESKFKKFKENTFFKLFFRDKGNNCSGFQNGKSSQNTTDMIGNMKKETEEEVIVMRSQINKKDTFLRGNIETKWEENEKPKQSVILEISEVNSKDYSCSSPKIVHTGEKNRGCNEKIMENKNLKKKQSKRRKIVENPGVSQMQGFFFQT